MSGESWRVCADAVACACWRCIGTVLHQLFLLEAAAGSGPGWPPEACAKHSTVPSGPE